MEATKTKPTEQNAPPQQPEVLLRFQISSGFRDIEKGIDDIHEMLIRARQANVALLKRLQEEEQKSAALQAEVDTLRAAGQKRK